MAPPSVGVLIPWRSTNCHRRVRALKYVCERYATERPDWDICVGVYDEDPWVKAHAVDAALKQTNADAFVVADADVWSDGTARAVDAIGDGHPWAMAHRGVWRLTDDASRRYLDRRRNKPPDHEQLPLERRSYLGVEGGGLVILPRATLEACPLDPRFPGWGAEDDSWGFALRTLYGPPWRGRAPLVHFWHPPALGAALSSRSSLGHGLRQRYARALNHPDAMRALVAEHTQ